MILYLLLKDKNELQNILNELHIVSKVVLFLQETNLLVDKNKTGQLINLGKKKQAAKLEFFEEFACFGQLQENWESS